jgi:hypothetical protein
MVNLTKLEFMFGFITIAKIAVHKMTKVCRPWGLRISSHSQLNIRNDMIGDGFLLVISPWQKNHNLSCNLKELIE